MTFDQQQRITGVHWALAALVLACVCFWLKPVLSPTAYSDSGVAAYHQDAGKADAASGQCSKVKTPLPLGVQLLLDLGVALLAVCLWAAVLGAGRHASWYLPDPPPWPCRPHQFHCVYLE